MVETAAILGKTKSGRRSAGLPEPDGSKTHGIHFPCRFERQTTPGNASGQRVSARPLRKRVEQLWTPMLRTDGVGCHNASKVMRRYSTANVELGLDVWAGDDDGREQRTRSGTAEFEDEFGGDD